MNTIYQTKPPADEFCNWGLNLYMGCHHYCVYCSAPNTTHRDPQEFWSNPYPRKDVIKHLEKDAARHAACPSTKAEPIQVSFITDPYQPLEFKLGLTRAALKIMLPLGLTVAILTKAGMAACRDFELMQEHPGQVWFGQSFTLNNPNLARSWEKRSALPNDRVAAARRAHEMGLLTWGSFEPVIMVEESLALLKKAGPFLDHLKVGKLNYFPHRSRKILWPEFAARFEQEARELGFQPASAPGFERGTLYFKKSLVGRVS